MKKHEFRLEQVLKFRQEVEKRHQLELAAVKLEQESTHDLLHSEKSAMDHLARECAQRQLNGIEAGEMQLYGDFHLRKKKEILGIRETLVGLEKQVQEKREALLVAAVDKKALEVFKEKKLRDLRLEQLSRERDFMDEIAIQSRGGQR